MGNKDTAKFRGESNRNAKQIRQIVQEELAKYEVRIRKLAREEIIKWDNETFVPRSRGY